MDGDVDVSLVAALLADPTRAVFVDTLIERHALTAGELARVARVTPSAASMHLGKLVDGGLVVVQPVGRHRYYRVASPLVAQAVEALARLAPVRPIRSLRESEQARALRVARTCYDHLAGIVAVQIARAFERREWIAVTATGYAVTPIGETALTGWGLDIGGFRQQRRQFATTCLDWSQRQYHIGGALGAAILMEFETRQWMGRHPSGRGISITDPGWAFLERELNILRE